MIVKMTILRLLGSSDDKEKEEIGVARPKGLRIRSTRRTDARASEHPVVVGRTDAMILWCRRESKPSQPIGTGSTDGASVHTTGVMTSASRRSFFSTG